MKDFTYSIRALAKSPAFTITAILTLALGIGANAAIFSVIDAVLLRPLPWGEPTRTAMIWSRWTAFDKTWVAAGEVVDYRKRLRSFTDVAAWSDGQINITGNGEPERVAYAEVTANTFQVLGRSPILGRTFTAAEDLPNGPRLAVISHALWEQRYGSDAAVVGRPIHLNGQPYEIVGVMPSGFLLPTDYQNAQPSVVWVPLQLDPASTDHGSHGYYAAGRLRPGVSVADATSDLHALADTMTREGLYPKPMQFDAFAVSLHDEVLGFVSRAIALLAAAVGLLLLIACANVANLMLARAEGRQRDVAVRTALGAGAARIVRQLLAESLVLSLAGALVGLVLAWGGVRALTWWHPESIPRVGSVGLNFRVLLFTMVTSVAVTVLFGVAPALGALRIDITEALKEGRGATSAKSGRRFRSALVVAQTALAVVLLVGAGLLVRSIAALQRVNLGFRSDHVLTMRVSLPTTSYASPEAVVGFYSRLLDEVRRLPGVRSAGAVRSLPLASEIGDWGLTADGYSPPPGTSAKGDWQVATDGYVEAMGERIVRGRAFTPDDHLTGPLVALVNEEFVRRYWPERDPIGSRIRFGGNTPGPWVTVVGVVANVRHNGVDTVVKEKFYVPHSQWYRASGTTSRSMTLVVRTAGDPAGLTGLVREQLRRLDATVPAADVRTMDDVVAAALSGPRFTGALLGVFALLALVLAAVGLYGVLAYTVSRRTREFGVRIAMGAGRAQVLRLVIGSGVALTTAGIGVGVVLAAMLTGFMSNLLHDVAPLDPWTFSTVPAALLAVAIVASAFPAWRATRIDPVHALRAE
jgi:putative ABC transport system permease protein